MLGLGEIMNLKKFEKELAELHDKITISKQNSMIYQYEAKKIVASYYKVPMEEVNLPFEKWMALRKKYELETGQNL